MGNFVYPDNMDKSVHSWFLCHRNLIITCRRKTVLKLLYLSDLFILYVLYLFINFDWCFDVIE